MGWWWWTGCRVVRLCVVSCRAGPRSRRYVADVPVGTFSTFTRTPFHHKHGCFDHTHKHTYHGNHTPRNLIHTTTHHPTTRNTLHTPQQHDNNTTTTHTHNTHTLKLKLHTGTPLHMAPTTNPPPNHTNQTKSDNPGMQTGVTTLKSAIP